jgi:protein TilB
MPRITEDLVRRRAEHNDCDITTLEEVSLHQQEIERIEHLDKWCRNLKILYLQNNLIPRIENVSRLKQLEYLNLALNNVERIENLEGCEFLHKLDLTVNFVGDLLSVETLRANHHFRELYLTGNPCTDYEGYREFVVATLPRLLWLDGKEVTKSERILATQHYQQVREKIVAQQKMYQAKREREKREHREKEEEKTRKKQRQSEPGFDGRWYTDPNSHQHPRSNAGEDSGADDNDGREEERGSANSAQGDDEDEKFWQEPTPYTPESRTEVHQYMAEKRRDKAKSPDNKGLQSYKRKVNLERDGKMLNVNEGRYDFQLREDDDNNQYVLEVAVPRYMDTSLVDCDVQPSHVRLNIKGKVSTCILYSQACQQM